MRRKTRFQGDSTDGLFFIQKGKVQLSVVSEAGKEATLGILSEGDFFGEGGLAGKLIRISSAIAVTDCVLLHVEKKAMMETMRVQPKLSAMFVSITAIGRNDGAGSRLPMEAGFKNLRGQQPFRRYLLAND